MSRFRTGDRYRRRVRDAYDPFGHWKRSSSVTPLVTVPDETSSTTSEGGHCGHPGQGVPNGPYRETKRAPDFSGEPPGRETQPNVASPVRIKKDTDHGDHGDHPNSSRADSRSLLATRTMTTVTGG